MKIKYIKLNTIKDILRFIMNERNLTKEQMLDFINNNKVFHSPYLLTNLQQAVDKIIYHIQNNNNITIIGDYDVDGICSTVVLYKTLKAVTENVHYIIPNRFTDGYGMSKNLIDKAKTYNTNLIITVDNGIKAHQEVLYAKSLNIDVVITDHHAFEDDTLPCEITVNPQIDNNYPFKGICGCMVVYKLCMVLIKTLNINIDKQQLSHLTSIATIADMMPLLDENRWFVSHYVKTLKQTSNIGLQALFSKLYMKKVMVDDIGFYIAPCLNASGRIESADYSAKLLLTDNEEEATQLAKYIIELNNKRKQIQNAVLNNIKIDNSHNIIFHVIDIKDISGVLGIIAAQIVNQYHKPCFVLANNNDILSGSGRSCNEYALNRIVELNDYVNGGGHKQACGISFNKIDLDRLQKFADKDYVEYLNSLPEQTNYIMQIDFDIINDRLLNNLEKLQPYGQNNSQPIFYTDKVHIETYNVVGKNNNVLRLSLKQNDIKLQAVMFNTKLDLNTINKNEVEIQYQVEYNEWNNTKSIQLRLLNIR